MITIRKHLSAMIIAFLTAACSGGGGDFASGSREKNDDQKDADEEESADPPEVVTGAYLTCSDTKSADADETTYGCNLTKSNGKPIKLGDVANSWKWQAVPPPDSEHSVKVADKSASGGQALFHFSGGDENSRRRYAEETQVGLALNLKKDVPGYKPFRSAIKDAGGQLGGSKEGNATGSGSTTDKLTLPQASPSKSTTSTDDEPIVLPELPVSVPDRDKDGVEDSKDRCNNTPAGSRVWKDGEWSGCTEGEFKDVDDSDFDRVPNSVDVCPGTAKGSIVDMDPYSPGYGCGPGQIIF